MEPKYKRVTCYKCNGDKEMSCPWCSGGFTFYVEDNIHETETSSLARICGFCLGRGYIRCDACSGNGYTLELR